MRHRLLPIVLSFVAASLAGAQAPTLAERAAIIERISTEREGIRVVVGHISREIAIPVDTLRAQRAQTGLGWGEILIAHRIAREAKVSFDDVAAEFRGGKSWEDVARARGVDVEKLTAAVERSQVTMERRGEDKAPPPIGGSPSAGPPSGGMAPSPLRRY